MIFSETTPTNQGKTQFQHGPTLALPVIICLHQEPLEFPTLMACHPGYVWPHGLYAVPKASAHGTEACW